MEKQSELVLPSITISVDIINRSIKDMLIEQGSLNHDRKHDEGFCSQFKLIKSAFESLPLRDLQKEDIAIRLSLLDLFYTTNLNRFAEFGLEELTETILNLCSDNNGKHSDDVLVKKTEEFVSDCDKDPEKARKSEIFEKLFSDSAKFGITKVNSDKEAEGSTAHSLISKYLYFLLETRHSEGYELGFPIYDSIASDLQRPLLKKLGEKIKTGKDIVGYVGNMTIVLNCLKNDPNGDSSVWKMPQAVSNTQFGLLDYFLWRIGKSGRFSFSLLWSREEKMKHYSAAKNLSDAINKNNRTNTIQVLNPQQDFDSLPARFRDWHTLYKSIKR